MARRKKTLIIVGLLGAATVAFGMYCYRIQTRWIASPPYQRTVDEPSRVLVAVYSLTGNTQSAAKEIARYFDADLLTISSPLYGRDLKGQLLASRDADNEVTTTPIEHAPVDMNQYELVFLCSPTWWFRPAVPLWSFVENHDFKGRSVYLVLTGNSRYKKEKIERFEDLVNQQNGRYHDLLFLRRGRIYWQKTPEEINTEVREALDARDFQGL
jgi:flavodoxin